MSKQDNEQQKASELLQQLHAAFLSGSDPEKTEPDEKAEEKAAPAEKVEKPAIAPSEPPAAKPEAPKPARKAAPKKEEKTATPAAILALTEEADGKVESIASPEPEKETLPAEKEAEKPIEKPAEKTPAKKAAPRDSKGTFIPRSARENPFLKQPSPVPERKPEENAEKKPEVPEKSAEPVKTETTAAPAASAEQKPKTTRPNTVKVPPRKRSGPQTGAIRPKNAPETVEQKDGYTPIVIKPQNAGTSVPPVRQTVRPSTRFGGTALPRSSVVRPVSPAPENKAETGTVPIAAQVKPAVKPEPTTQKPAVASIKDSAATTPAKTEPAKEPIAKQEPVPAAQPAPKPSAFAAEPIKPAPEQTAPRKEADRTVSPSSAPKPESAPAAKPTSAPKPEPPKAASAGEKPPVQRPASRVIVDFDGPTPPTVEPIENVEAAETVSEPPKKKSPFARRSKKQRKAEEGLDATAIIAKRTGLDESDIALIFELGYENELGRLVGYEMLKKLKYEHLRLSRSASGDYYSQAFGYRGKEYTSATPREQVLAAYTHDRRNLLIRIALMALLSVVLFIADFPFLLGGFFQTYSAKLPFLFPAIGFVLLVTAAILLRHRIIAGWRAFLRFAPSPYSAISVALPFMLVYSLASLTTAADGTLLPMNFATVLSLLTLTVCDAIRIADEIRTFRVVSEPGDKTVLEESEPRKKKLRQGNRTVKILNDEAGEQLYRVRPTHEIVGFFRRMNDLSAASVPFTRMTVFLLVCAVAGGLTASLVLHNPLRGILVTAATLMFSVPVSATFLFFDPLRRANRRLVSRRSVLVGEGSVNEYSGEKTVIFNDTESFRAKRQTQVALRDGDDFQRDMRLAGILFRKLGGTLSTIGDGTPGNGEPDPTVNLIRLTETGVEALVDTRYRLLAGDAFFMTHSGISVPKESTDRTVIRSRGVSILYVAVNGTLKLTYEVGYTMSQSFREVIALLAQTETTLAVQSYDPNLNDAFLHVGFADGDEVVRVIKPAQFELPMPAEITDTGAVTLDGPLATAYPLRAASLIVSARRTGFRALLTSILPGALIAFFAVRNLPANILPYLPLFAVGYRAIWFAVSWLISAYSLRRRAVFDDTRENLANEDQQPS